ncbi:MAG: RsmD family RNA methyltransferase [Actinomycetes bacterium]
MRVISGEARGRNLRAALPEAVRPTTDRVKESIFDILGSFGGVVDLEVVDLFCGSGALGIEALSRGASSVVFVDADPLCLEAARENLAMVGLDPTKARFVRASFPGWTSGPVDLVLADPPYGLDVASDLLASLDTATLVLESRVAPIVPEGWVSLRQRTYGTTIVTVLNRKISESSRS